MPYTGGTANVNEGILAFTNSYTQNSGVLFLNGGDVSTTTTLNILGGTVAGTGTITGDVANSGTIAPGASAGQLAITGDPSLGSSSQLAIELGGTTQGVSSAPSRKPAALRSPSMARSRSPSSTASTAQNARQDVNANGSINATDVGLVKSRSGTSISLPAAPREQKL